ncbi:MAG: hypothetical protein GY950_05220 [bacterium]|nr:hypothetical protein [bacterium]
MSTPRCFSYQGMQNAFGLNKDGYPPWVANFLTDGKNGAPMGEGLKATPQLAQEFVDRAKAPEPTGDCVMVGPFLVAPILPCANTSHLRS